MGTRFRRIEEVVEFVVVHRHRRHHRAFEEAVVRWHAFLLISPQLRCGSTQEFAFNVTYSYVSKVVELRAFFAFVLLLDAGLASAGMEDANSMTFSRIHRVLICRT